MAGQPEQTIRFERPVTNGAFYCGDWPFSLKTWVLRSTVEPPVDVDAFMDVVTRAVPSGQQEPLEGYRVSHTPEASDEQGEAADVVSSFAIDYLLRGEGFDLSHDDTARTHLAEEVAPAVASALGARIIRD